MKAFRWSEATCGDCTGNCESNLKLILADEPTGSALYKNLVFHYGRISRLNAEGTMVVIVTYGIEIANTQIVPLWSEMGAIVFH